MLLAPGCCVCPRERREILKEDNGFIEWRCRNCGAVYTCHESAFYRDREGS